MKSLEATQLLPAPAWSDPRVHLLDDLWLLTIFAILFVAGVPWLVSSFELQIGAALIGLLALTAIHVAFTMLAAPSKALHPGRRRALALLHAVGVVIVGLVWHYAGGLQNPAFLIVFVLPVIGAIFLSRWQPYVVAVLAIVVAAAVAASEAPELRWYVSGLDPAGAWLSGLFGRPAAEAATPFPGFYAPTGYFLVLLEVFAILMVACAFAAEYLGTVFDRLHAHVTGARADAERAQELWASLIEELPLPAVLVDASSLQIVAESAAFATVSCTEGAPASGRKLSEAVRFSYPDIVEELVKGTGGAAEHLVLRPAGELRVAGIRVQHLAHRGRRLALILIEETTQSFAVRAALDAAEQAILVIDAGDRVLAFNKPALALFSGTRVGSDASSLLSQPQAPPRWWEPGLTGRRKMHLRILPRIFQVTSTAIALPGEEERIVVVAFLPVARAEAQEIAQLGVAPANAPLARPR
ncbi:MAG TPA: PAS domain-containing protein [Steroidobacteraceae bacterium]|nr:PAS domain-containing protein [Steroidobacteraceae bacterium]